MVVALEDPGYEHHPKGEQGTETWQSLALECEVDRGI